jgi:iron complex outermembrane receptor protein
MKLHRYAESRDDLAEAAEGSSPRHQFQVHSYISLPRSFELDTALYCVSSLPEQHAASYARLDVRIGWRFGERFEVSAAGQNLLDERHAEFTGDGNGVRSSFVKRSAYGSLTWHF